MYNTRKIPTTSKKRISNQKNQKFLKNSLIVLVRVCEKNTEDV